MATLASNLTHRVDSPCEQDAAFAIMQSRLCIATDVACDNPDDGRQGVAVLPCPTPILLKDMIASVGHDRPRFIMAAGLAGHIGGAVGLIRMEVQTWSAK